MSAEIEPNAVAASVITDLTKDFLKGVTSFAKHKVSEKWEKVFPHFEAHLLEVHKRSTCVKILCAYDTPVDFKSIYVAPKLQCGEEIISDKEVVKRLHQKGRLIIKSNGGSGKTFLTKHLWLSIFEDPKGRFPILIELRGLNDPTEFDLVTYIRATAFKAGGITEENFRQFCKEGAFIFIFDGFDEVERKHRAKLEKQIISLSDDYLDCSIVVTGRPDDRFESWTKFTLLSCLPFNYTQFHELITKVPFDEKSKRNFLKAADELFFNEHNDFLANPLLSLMMLMTYRDNAEIPSKLSVFYENCYLTLYQRHDALKEQYSRNKLFDQDEFRQIFSVFSFFTYLKSKAEMDEAEIRHYISKAIDFTGLDASVGDVLEEFRETVNLIQKDGIKFTFIHRSFQEYFAAYCATKVMTDKTAKILSVFAERMMDSTFKLSHEMHPRLIYKKYLIPTYDELNAQNVLVSKKSKVKPYATLCSSKFEISIYTAGNGNISAGWGADRKVDIFEARAAEVLNFEKSSNEMAEIIFDAYKKIMDFHTHYSSSAWPKKLSVEFKIEFDEDTIRVQSTTSKNYKRLPKALKDLEVIVNKEISAIAKKLNETRRLSYLKLTAEMEKTIESLSEKSHALEDEFGL